MDLRGAIVLVSTIVVGGGGCDFQDIDGGRESNSALVDSLERFVRVPTQTVAFARRGYADAREATPPPAPGTSMPRLRLSRPVRTVDELTNRLVGVLDSMGREIPAREASTWAETVALAVAEPSLTEPISGVVVLYDAQLDDLLVMDTTIPRPPAHESEPDVPWGVAESVVETLAHREIIPRSVSIATAGVAYVRSGIKGPDSHEQWVDEILFETNARIEGIPLLDSGVRIGVTPSGDVSSLRVTGIDVEWLDRVTIGASSDALEDAFSAHVGASRAIVEAVHVSRRRPAYLLDPSITSSVVEPGYVMEYSTVARMGESLSASRTTMVLLGMVDPEPSVELHFPESI